jgi:DNA polymerase delta subunit 3
MDSEAEREARALMDLDDGKLVRFTALLYIKPFVVDQVERVSHAPSTAVSEFEDQSETDSAPVKIEHDDGDVDMTDHSVAPIRPKKRKAKTTIPVGSNGLKKRKIVRTRSRKDDNGYVCTWSK